MKTFSKIILSLLFVVLSKLSFAQGFPCPNGGVENGTTLGWRSYFGEYDAGLLPSLNAIYPIPTNKYFPVPFVLGGRIAAVLASPVDYVGQYPRSAAGSFGLQIGDTSKQNFAQWDYVTNTLIPHQQAQMAGYTFSVNNLKDPVTNKCILKFMYALSFNFSKNSETPQIGARFNWFITQQNPNPKPTDPLVMAAGSSGTVLPTDNNPVFRQSPTMPPQKNVVDYYYADWTCQSVDLTAYAGQVLTIWFNTSNCRAGGHWMTAYIDGLCEKTVAQSSFTLNANVYCLNSTNPIAFDGTASKGDHNYRITIQECDINQQIIPGSTPVFQNFSYQQVGKIDLRNWYVNIMKKQFKPNTYYRVGLYVSNACDNHEVFQKIYIDSPIPNAGSDKALCCNSNLSASIGVEGSSLVAGSTYNWTSTPVGYSKAGVTSALVSPAVSTTYHLTVTDQLGCVAVDNVDVLVIPNQNLVITYGLPITFGTGNCNPGETQAKPTSCDIKLSVSFPDFGCNGSLDAASTAYWSAKYLTNTTFKWNTGETTPSISPKSGVSNYSVTVTNACFSKTLNYTLPAGLGVPPAGYFNQAIPPISVQNPPASWINDVAYFRILEMGANAPALGVGPAYHAYRYALKLTQLSGSAPGTVYCQQGYSAAGFKNGDIAYPVIKDVNGLYKANLRWGTYKWELTLWNCATPLTGQSSFTTETLVSVCTEYKWKINWKVLGIQFHSGKYCSRTAMVYGNPTTVTGGTFVFGEPGNVK